MTNHRQIYNQKTSLCIYLDLAKGNYVHNSYLLTSRISYFLTSALEDTRN